MANWDGQKVDSSNINNGNQFGEEGIAYEDINAVVNNSIYASNFADHLADTPDTSEAGNVGTPSVSLINNVVGSITYKKFKFSNLKGAQGQQGIAAGFGVPTVSTTTGAAGSDASVTVNTDSQSPNTAKVFEFAFTIPRGNVGATGATALTYSLIPTINSSITEGSTFNATNSYFNRTPVVGEYVNVVCKHSVDTYILVCSITSVSTSTSTLTILKISNITGATFTPSVSSAGVISWTNNGGLNNPSSVNIKGADGTAATINGSSSNSLVLTMNKDSSNNITGLTISVQ